MTDNWQVFGAAQQRTGSKVCLALDIDPATLDTGESWIRRASAVIGATRDVVCAYKLNTSYLWAAGMDGAQLAGAWHLGYQDVPLIIDGKFGDVQNTSEVMARTVFEHWQADAATINPWGGPATFEPWLSHSDKLIFVWALSSPHPSDVQFRSWPDVLTHAAAHGQGAVVGSGSMRPANWTLSDVRQSHPDIPLLIPGIGAQGGHLAATAQIMGERAMVTIGRGILGQSGAGQRYLDNVRAAACRYRDAINAGQETVRSGHADAHG